MGIRALTAFVLLTSPLAANQVLFLMQSGKFHDAITHYRIAAEKAHHFELLEQMGLAILDQGARSDKPEEQLITLLGAGISANEKTSYILEKFVNSPSPQFQLISLQFLSRYQNNESNIALMRAMRSDNLLIRLEAAQMMAATKHPKAIGQIEALMQKIPSELHVVFPQLFALEGSEESMRQLKRLLGHPKEEVRIASILSVAEHKRDDLLPQIRKMASHQGIGQQEAAAYALGALHDETSLPILKTLSESKTPSVRVAALRALYQLGVKEAGSDLERLAKQNDLPAIIALGDVKGSEETLASFRTSSSGLLRIHAGMSLLKLKDKRALPLLQDVFFPDQRDLAFVRGSSVGKTFAAWKVTPGASQQLKDEPLSYELSLEMREQLLTQAIDLPGADFLELADAIFSRKQNDLVPTLCHLLENIQSKEVIALLKKYQQHAGAPFVRHYAALTLYRLKEEGPYASILRDFVTSEQKHEMIQLRPYIPFELREPTAKFQITPREMSRLLIETFESFAAAQDDLAIDILLEAIQHGNRQNRFALAGLLLRTVQ